MENEREKELDKNAEPAKISHEVLTIRMMHVTIQMDKNAESAYLYH